MLKILVSGFEPFGGSSKNPTEMLVRAIAKESFEGAVVRTVLLPVFYDQCVDLLLREFEAFRPDAVISCGLAGGRGAVTPERIAVNLKDIAPETPFADNRGARPSDEPINPDGPDGLFASLPVRRMVNRMKDEGIPAAISYTAGTFICNNTMYSVLDHIRMNRLPTLAGFVHFPASDEMAVEHPSWPTLPHALMLSALRIIIQTTIDELQPDQRTGA